MVVAMKRDREREVDIRALTLVKIKESFSGKKVESRSNVKPGTGLGLWRKW